MSPARYLTLFLATLIGSVALVMSTVYLVDPLQFFRRAQYAPLWSYEQRHQAAAIARTFPFEVAVTGNSSMGTVTARDLSEVLGMRAEHLGMDGSTPFEQHRLLSLALARQPLRVVVWGVSDFSLTWPPPADIRRTDLAPDPAHLYSPNPLAWSRYLFDLTAFGSSLAVAGTRLVRFPGYRQIDQPSLTVPPRSWVFGAEALRNYMATLESSCRGRRSTVPEAPFRYNPRPVPGHIERRMEWIRDLARAHPDTRFELVFPPVHVWLHRIGIVCGNDWLDRVHVYDRLAEYLVGIPNVRIHDFRTSPISLDADNFYDAVHFSPAAAREMLSDIAAGRRVVAPAAVRSQTEALLGLIRREVCERTPGITCTGN